MTVKIHVIKAFSINKQGGNPAGVIFDAEQFSNATRQTIAAIAGFPETAFVSASNIADYKLDFFTPTKQIPHCGHATIGTFSYLKSIGKITGDHSSKETIDGVRTILFQGDMAFMEQKAPVVNEISDPAAVLNSLHISSGDLLEGHLPTLVNTGNTFLLVPVKNERILAGITYDSEAVFQISKQFNAIGFYVFAPSPDADATARMFGPFYGIEEEAATGMAAGPLSAYLNSTGLKRQSGYRIEQGRFMTSPSPSLIYVKLDIADDKITRLFAGGYAYLAEEKTLHIPDVRI